MRAGFDWLLLGFEFSHNQSEPFIDICRATSSVYDFAAESSPVVYHCLVDLSLCYWLLKRDARAGAGGDGKAIIPCFFSLPQASRFFRDRETTGDESDFTVKT